MQFKRLVVLFLVLVCSGLHAADRAKAPASQPSSSVISELNAWLGLPIKSRGEITDQPFAFEPMSGADAQTARQLLWGERLAELRRDRQAEWAANSIAIGPHVMRLKRRTEGAEPPGGWPLFISLHGGGGAPPAVNDEQWSNQIRLYHYANAKIIAPRAPTDTWNLWHEAHVDPLIDRVIQDAVALEDVNPDRVYLQGYSAGGDGVYQLAPRMADRFAAAAMMAGHPNNASPLGLRNLPFTIHVGALDSAYDRNKVAGEWGDQLDALQAADPAGYTHWVSLHAGMAHWMHLTDQPAVDWMLKFTRKVIPQRVVWKQNEVTHDRFYWLAVPHGTAVKGAEAVVQQNGQRIDILQADGIKKLIFFLDDRIVDCDQPVVVTFHDRELFRGDVPRTIATEQATLSDRDDRELMFDGSITVDVSASAGAGAQASTTPSSVTSSDVSRAVAYLKAHRQDRDQPLSDAFLQEHAAMILSDRNTQPWRDAVPDELFDEYVLPFATLDESREAWADFLKPVATKLVATAKTCADAAEMLNNGIFEQFGVRYNATKRLRPNQCISESIVSGYASCTGLSIILVDACRSVGVPARIVGVQDWISPKGPTFQGSGNHTWVEIWDGRQWRFIGASENSKLDQTWFADRAKQALEHSAAHAIFAACFTSSPDHFPLAWSPGDANVPAIDVTEYYTNRKLVHFEAPPGSQLLIRDGGRLVAAGSPGGFILAGKRNYSVQIIARDGTSRFLSQQVK